MWKNNKHFSIDTDTTPKFFTPIAASHGYNCIIEHETFIGGDGADQYLIFSSELLDGKCCKFFSRKQLNQTTGRWTTNNSRLSNLNIYDIKSVSILKSLLK